MKNEQPFSVVTEENLANFTFPSKYVLFKTPSDFSQYIELTAIKEEKTCTQVVLDYCEDRNIWPNDIAKLVNTSLKGKIQVEMIEAGFLEQQNTLE